MADPSEIDRDLQTLAAELRRLEGEYNMYFGGRMPRPPVETRRRVQTMVRQLDRQSIGNYAARFRFTTLQSRFQTLCDLWDRGSRAREEGRPGPFAGRTNPAAGRPPASREPSGALSFRDPAREPDKLRALHEKLTEARRQAGESALPFHEFAAIVQKEVRELQRQGTAEVAVRVTVKDGAVSLTAKDVREKDEP